MEYSILFAWRKCSVAGQIASKAVSVVFILVFFSECGGELLQQLGILFDHLAGEFLGLGDLVGGHYLAKLG